MSDRIETELRRALRATDPGDEFTRSVMARVHAQPSQTSNAVGSPVLRWLPAALAASLLVAIIVKHEAREPALAEGELARKQLLEALRVTSQKLDIAYQVVHNQSDATDEPGA